MPTFDFSRLLRTKPPSNYHQPGRVGGENSFGQAAGKLINWGGCLECCTRKHTGCNLLCKHRNTVVQTASRQVVVVISDVRLDVAVVLVVEGKGRECRENQA